MKKYVCVETMRSPDSDDKNQTPASLIARAEEMFALGCSRNAACDARSAIEKALYASCVACEVYPRNPKTGEKLRKNASRRIFRTLITLEFIEVVGPEKRREIIKAAEIGNHGAHGDGVKGSDALHAIETAKWCLDLADRLIANPKIPVITPRKANLAEVSE